MAPKTTTSEKQKRRKKRNSRTEVSSDSDTESDSKGVKNSKTEKSKTDDETPQNKEMTDTEISTVFTKFYMQRMAAEFSDDLDRLRNADDFKDEAMPLLINALQQGTSLFSIEEQRRIVMAGIVKKKDS